MRLWPARLREEPISDEVTIHPTSATQPQISAFWASLSTNDSWWMSLYSANPRLAEKVWVVNRCLQLCSQQIASMPLRFFGARSEPAWVANPDPAWYPNGIGDAVFAATWGQLGWGDSFLYVTARYADGFPSAWTVLDPSTMTVKSENGRRSYRSGQNELNPDDVVQISRDPRGGLTGTSAVASYAGPIAGIIGATALGASMVTGGGSVPNAVLKSSRRLTPDQAQQIQTAWMAARARSAAGAPAVLPPEISFEQLSFSASDLLLLDALQFDARAIASAFSVPAFMLNMPLEGGLTYQNPETLFEVWWRAELRHIAGRVQRALSANMLPRGSWVEFDARAVLAPPFQAQVTAWLQLLEGGVVTQDEVRAAILHLPPRAQGEAIEELTEPPTAAAGPADLADVQTLRPAVGA